MKNIYEINTATWLYRLSEEQEQPVTLGTVPDHELARIARFGIDCVWLMGIWQRSEVAAEISRSDEGLVQEVRALLPDYTPEDIIGSAYAVKQYTIDSRFGTADELQQLRARLAERGMKLILDYVPNHTAFDHPWTLNNPEYYITDTAERAIQEPSHFRQCGEHAIANGSDPTLAAWPDVAQLNAFDAGYRDASIRTIVDIAALCDGVRCDMSMLLLNDIFGSAWKERAGDRPEQEYWDVVIRGVKQHYPEFVFMAETYWDTEERLVSLGFDYCYDKRLYDQLVAGNMAEAAQHYERTAAIRTHMVHFLENHDEPRIASLVDADVHRQAAAYVHSLQSTHLWHDGQFEGFRKKIPVHVRRAPAEQTDAEVAALYNEVFTSSN